MRWRRSRARLVWALVGCGGLCMAAAADAAEPVSEAQVKAAFIYNFAKFIEWPAPAQPEAVFTICATGNEAVAGALEQALSGKTLHSRPVAVRGADDYAALPGCRIVFVGAEAQARFDDIKQAAGAGGVLLVSEWHDGLLRGAAINFLLQQNTVRFEISLPAAQQAQLKISSQLLKLAVRVR